MTAVVRRPDAKADRLMRVDAQELAAVRVPEVEEHVAADGYPRRRHLVIPKLVDVRDGTAVYDERQARKAPDWTYL